MLLHSVVDSVSRSIGPNPVWRDVLIGVVGGIVTTVIIWCFSVGWKKILEPWFEARVYKGIDVSGSWRLANPALATGEFQFSDHETLEISQSAHRLRGSLTLLPIRAQSAPRTQEITGEIRDRLVCITGRSRSRQRVGFTSVIAEVSPDGQQMTGHAAYYDLDISSVASAEVVYVRRP